VYWYWYWFVRDLPAARMCRMCAACAACALFALTLHFACQLSWLWLADAVWMWGVGWSSVSVSVFWVFHLWCALSVSAVCWCFMLSLCLFYSPCSQYATCNLLWTSLSEARLTLIRNAYHISHALCRGGAARMYFLGLSFKSHWRVPIPK
jgi:hypothetical protein